MNASLDEFLDFLAGSQDTDCSFYMNDFTARAICWKNPEFEKSSIKEFIDTHSSNSCKVAEMFELELNEVHELNMIRTVREILNFFELNSRESIEKFMNWI